LVKAVAVDRAHGELLVDTTGKPARRLLRRWTEAVLL
jgi:hypothetical protein